MTEAIEGYAAYRARMSEKATAYEDFAFDLLRQKGITVVRYVSREWQFRTGECSGGIEVKFDDRMAETGNIYVETAEKACPDPSRDYEPSGIYREDNSWLYVIGDYDEVFVFTKTMLRLLDNSRRKRKEAPTSRGFVLPGVVAGKYAGRVLVRGKDYE